MTSKQSRPPRQGEHQSNAAQRRERVRLEQLRKAKRRRVRIGAVLAAIAALAIVLAVVLLGQSNRAPVATPATMSTTAPPWPIPQSAAPFIAAAGLQVLGQEGTRYHYHAHLDVIVNSQPVTVPMYVGFDIVNRAAVGLSALHTHDNSGIIHIETQTNSPFVLGQFFTEWGVRLARGELGGLVDGGGNSLRTYVNGHLFSGDPASILLRRHEEIVLWYGPSSQTPTVPSSYRFPAGL